MIDLLRHLARRIDARFTSDLATRPGPMRSAAALLTHSGDGLPVLIIIGLFVVLSGAEGRRIALIVLAADTLTFLIVQILKVTIKRKRPTGEWGRLYRKLDPHSFPSGHAARGGTIALMALLLGPPWFRVVGPLWGVLVALSRVVMGVHFASDIIAGFVLGAAVASVVGGAVLILGIV